MGIAQRLRRLCALLRLSACQIGHPTLNPTCVATSPCPQSDKSLPLTSIEGSLKRAEARQPLPAVVRASAPQPHALLAPGFQRRQTCAGPRAPRVTGAAARVPGQAPPPPPPPGPPVERHAAKHGVWLAKGTGVLGSAPDVIQAGAAAPPSAWCPPTKRCCCTAGQRHQGTAHWHATAIIRQGPLCGTAPDDVRRTYSCRLAVASRWPHAESGARAFHPHVLTTYVA